MMIMGELNPPKTNKARRTFSVPVVCVFSCLEYCNLPLEDNLNTAIVNLTLSVNEFVPTFGNAFLL